MQTEVKLITWTNDPLATAYILWEASRSDKFNETIQSVRARMQQEPAFKQKVEELFLMIISNNVPVAENLTFTFILDGVSVALREQMVRHRIGVKVGERLGADFVPELHDSTWWSQSMRVLNMGAFAAAEAFQTPEAIKEKESANMLYKKTMFELQESYNKLVEMGVPLEEARMVLPLSVQHRISWTLNLSAIQHIVKKRSCWILQLGFWESVIFGMINELCEKVSPVFASLITPPCIVNEKFKGCVHPLDSLKRCQGEDPLPPCSLYLHNSSEVPETALEAATQRKDYIRQSHKYHKFWRRNEKTGERE